MRPLLGERRRGDIDESLKARLFVSSEVYVSLASLRDSNMSIFAESISLYFVGPFFFWAFIAFAPLTACRRYLAGLCCCERIDRKRFGR